MKEIGSKFVKFGDTSLTALAKEMTVLAEDLSPAIAEPKFQIKDSDNISLLTLNNSKVFIYSQQKAGLNLYKILNYVKPEKIFLQIRPDDVYTKDPLFLIPPSSIISSLREYSETVSQLRNSGFIISEGPRPKVLESKVHFDRISQKTCMFLAIWALQHNHENVCAADIPRDLYYRMISNAVTVMQLQGVYSHVTRLIGVQPDSIEMGQPDFPMTLAYKHYPHIFEAHTITYMSKLLTEATLKYKKIMCITSRETGQRLEKNLVDGYVPTNYEVSLFNDSIVRKEISENVTEKMALIDALSFGVDFINKISGHSALERLDKFINELIEIERKETNYTMALKDINKRKDFLEKLYLSLLKRYSTFGNEKIKDGRETLHTEFLKNLMRGY